MGSVGDARTQEIIRAAEQAMQRGDARGALGLLRQAEAAAPADIDVKMQLALAQRTLGDFPGALASLDDVLALDPGSLVAILSKGWILERMNRPREAALAYRSALHITPPDDRLPQGLKAPVARARQVVQEDALALEAFLRARVSDARGRHAGEGLDRFDQSLQIFAGSKLAYAPRPALLHFPELPPIQFFDRALFPWFEQLEAATEVIREELLVVMREDLEQMEPYIQYPPGVPVNQWVELNHSPRWNSYFLWRDGKPVQEHQERCPNTAAVLKSLPMLDQPGFGPTAMYSVLAPRTTIPAHTGSSNTRLVCHLPLLLPGPSRFRVGNDVREWKMGEAWVFDDTIEHEAWNDADQTRVVLIFDIWNPFLTVAERDLVGVMMAAKNAYARGEA